MQEINVAELEVAMRTGATLVDVREPVEYAEAHVPGALSVPMGQLTARVGELDTSAPLYLICASGNRSGVMCEVLRGTGVRAVNVNGGTAAWARSGRPVTRGVMPTTDLTILTIDTPSLGDRSLGDRSYLVHDGEVALVVDPQRDIDRVLDLLEEHAVRLTHVFETHIHNDYLTGGLALAERTGAAYHVNEADPVKFERVPLRDGQEVLVGDRMRVTALSTPGHTFTHLSYALTDLADGTAVGVFSGGSLLFGATGRPDLLGPDHTHDLVRHQHASAHRLAALLPDDAGVFPTHGFGSFCSATQSEATSSTIGLEKVANPVLTQDEETYVAELLAGLDAWPAYYAHMGPGNTAGPAAPDLSPPQLADAAELRRRIEAGEWVVDLRHRSAFAAGHAPGSLNFGLDGAHGDLRRPGRRPAPPPGRRPRRAT